MKRYKYSTLLNIVKGFHNKKLIVIGDLLLDQFIYGEVSRISPEAPVPVVWVKEERFMPGGACNVASNLAKLGGEVSLVGVIGKDEKAGILKDKLKEGNISTEGIIADGKRPTILKTRVIAHHQQVVRIDREIIDQVAPTYLKKVQSYLNRNIKDIDGVIIEDYGKGFVTPSLIKMVLRLAKKYGKIVAVDPKESHFSYYQGGIDVITPNRYEAEKAVGFPLKDKAALKKAGEKLLKKYKAKVILITLGEEGMMVFEKGKRPCPIPTLAQDVFDVSGAGDTVIAVYALAVISGASPIIAAHIANCAAGIVVGKVGVVPVEKEELKNRLKQETEKVGQ